MAESSETPAFRRARSRADREDRREAILDAAASLFDRIGFRDLSMSLLAERSGVAKGTLYLYFPTKEAVFLALYQREMTAWFMAVSAAIPELPQDDHHRLAGLLVDAVESRPQLPALASLLHTVLERNIPFEDALAFKRELLASTQALAGVLENRVEFLGEGGGLRLLLRVHALLIGTWQAATPAPIARRVLDEPGMEDLRIDFSEEFENSLVLLLEGWRRAEGDWR